MGLRSIEAKPEPVAMDSVHLNFLRKLREELPRGEREARLFIARQGHGNALRAANTPEGRNFLAERDSARLGGILANRPSGA